jgi:hypothetical protein
MTVAVVDRKAALGELCRGSLEFLGTALSEDEGLFSFSARFQGGRVVNDFANPLAVRYTVNTLLGLREAARVEPGAPLAADYALLLERFLQRQYNRIESRADLGLLLVLLGAEGHEEIAADAFRRVDAASRNETSKLNLQDLAWMLWGATELARTGNRGAEPVAHRLAAAIMDEFTDPRSGLPRHTLARHRAHVVSFGSVVYFLRSLHEYGTAFGNGRALTLFAGGVERMLAVQGPLGEWPWMIAVADGRPLDFYPVFTVHQDSMAMLFLLPALDEVSSSVLDEAVRRSFSWNLGANQLGRPLVVRKPFGIYRSIERRDRAPRGRRYLRTLVAAGRPASAQLLPNDHVRINPEVRSYHLGWILFVWAGRADAPALSA